jgi:hypothetical protein
MISEVDAVFSRRIDIQIRSDNFLKFKTFI